MNRAVTGLALGSCDRKRKRALPTLARLKKEDEAKRVELIKSREEV